MLCATPAAEMAYANALSLYPVFNLPKKKNEKNHVLKIAKKEYRWQPNGITQPIFLKKRKINNISSLTS